MSGFELCNCCCDDTAVHGHSKFFRLQFFQINTKHCFLVHLAVLIRAIYGIRLLACKNANCTLLASFGLRIYCLFVLLSSGSSVSVSCLFLKFISDMMLMSPNVTYTSGSCSSCVIFFVLSFYFSVTPVVCSVMWLSIIVCC